MGNRALSCKFEKNLEAVDMELETMKNSILRITPESPLIRKIEKIELQMKKLKKEMNIYIYM